MRFELIPNGLSYCEFYLPQADITAILNRAGGEGMATVLSTGVDEAGRDPLVGSVFAAVVILPKHFDLPGLTDSRRLSEKKRDMLAQMIKEQAVVWSITFADPDETLQLNILHAAIAAMKRAIEGLPVVPDKVQIDGNHVPKDLNAPAETVVRGDSKAIEVSAASVLTKTARDAEMYELAKCYPQYRFDRHKGCGTAQHLAVLKRHGVLPEHRRDFVPVETLLAQDSLFEE